MSGTRPILDLYRVEDMDDVDLEGLRRRLDLLLRNAPGTVNSGTEGVSNGHNILSAETGLRGMAFHHATSISVDFRHTRGGDVGTNVQMPADETLKAAVLEGRPGVEAIVRLWRTILVSNTKASWTRRVIS